MKLTCYDIFHVFCCCATLVLIGRCIYLYFEDEDVTQVEFYKFYDPNVYFYPSFSFCLSSPFIGKETFKTYYPNATDEELKLIFQKYFLLLKNGTLLRDLEQNPDLESDLQTYFQIDYDKMTKNLADHFHRFQVKLRNGDALAYQLANGSFTLKAVSNGAKKDQLEQLKKKYEKLKMPTVMVSQRSFNEKCYTFSPPYIPDESIESMIIYIHPTILSKEQLKLKNNQFSIYLHFPHQRIRARSADFGWTSKYAANKKQPKFYTKSYFIENIEVLKRRNKRTKPCINDNYDDAMNEYAIKRVGCKNPANSSKMEAPYCKTKESFDEFKSFVNNNNKRTTVSTNNRDSLIPCDELQSFFNRIEEKEEVPEILQKKFKEQGKGLIDIEIVFLGELYKQIIYVKSFGFESMIGNGGGYIG